MAHEPLTFAGYERLIVTFCTVLVLTAVFLNFALARDGHAAQRRRKSIVATGSMLAFFVGFYWLIRLRIGTSEIPGIRYPAAFIGLSLLLMGTLVNVTGRVALGRNWGNQIIIYQDHKLVTRGVYRIVRHPLYAGLIWMFTGAALIFQNWAALASVIFIFYPAMYYRAKLEENALVARFPDYVDYRNRTGMFFPITMKPEAVPIPRSAFAFCRISLTVILWLALCLNSVWLVVLVFSILTVSVLLKIQRSPMIVLYRQTVLRLWPAQRYEMLDVPAMRFAHLLGTMMSLAVILAMLASVSAGWYCLMAFCILKTTSALGFCPASKLFVCMRNGGCCALTRFA